MIGGFLEDVALGAQAGFQGHHDGFAQRVDRRVGDLRELLAEIIVGRTHPARQHRHRRVVAHGAHRLLALFGQRAQHLVTLLEGDLEHLHVLPELVAIVEGRAMIVVVQGRLDAQRVLTQPLLVGVLGFQPVVDVVGVQHLPGVSIHGQDLARADAALGDDILGLVVPDADFRGQGDVAVLGGDPARRTQAVAIEQADRVAAIGEHHASRTVPGLHVHGVVFVERAQVRVHGFHVLPGRRNDHAQTAEQVHAAGDQQLQHVVHARRVGTATVDQRIEALQIRQLLVGELQAARLGPVAVAGDGVDLAVVGEKAERLRQRPLRHGVGGEALVEDADGGGQTLVAEVREELRQVRRHHQTFIDDVLVGEAADIELLVLGQGHFGPATCHEQLDAELTLGQAVGTDEHLLDARQPLQRQATQHAGIDRHLAPADQGQSLRGDLLVEARAGGIGLGSVLAEKDHAHRVEIRQLGIEVLAGHGAQEGIRLLHQQPATIAGLAIGVDAAAVGHAGQ